METQAQLESQVHSFNKTYQIGDRVKLEMDNGDIKMVTVRMPATVLSGHSAVGWFKEISGCYSLDRVRA